MTAAAAAAVEANEFSSQKESLHKPRPPAAAAAAAKRFCFTVDDIGFKRNSGALRRFEGTLTTALCPLWP